MSTPTSTAASPATPAGPTGSRHTAPTKAILAIILASYFMILLDNSIIFTALPTIHAAMRFSSTGLAWVQDAYTLVFGGLLLLGARAGDMLGRRRVFVFGLAVFAFASLLVGFAPAGWWLIASPIWNVRPPMIMTTFAETRTSPARPSSPSPLMR